jgi:hypothetical protein
MLSSAYWLGVSLSVLVALLALAAMTIRSGYRLRIRSSRVEIELTPASKDPVRPKTTAERP